MVKYVAHPLNYRQIPSYDLRLCSWLHFPTHNDQRHRIDVPEFVPSSAVPARQLVGESLNLSITSGVQKVEFTHSSRAAQQTLFRLKQDVKLLDNHH